jgi:hypothetical protein
MKVSWLYSVNISTGEFDQPFRADRGVELTLQHIAMRLYSSKQRETNIDEERRGQEGEEKQH